MYCINKLANIIILINQFSITSQTYSIQFILLFKIIDKNPFRIVHILLDLII